MTEADQVAKFFGKYRGKVLENIDPLFQGRIMAEVPAIPGSLMNFALPCVPYAGPGVGFYAIPPIGANVWMEFEGGDPNYPIWSGCFWGPEDILHVPMPPPPEVKVFKTDFISMVLNDLPSTGGFTLECNNPAVAVPLAMTFDSMGITLSCPEATIKLTPASLELAVPAGTITVTPALISLAVPDSLIQLTPEVTSISVSASASIELTPAAIEIEAASVSNLGSHPR